MTVSFCDILLAALPRCCGALGFKPSVDRGIGNLVAALPKLVRIPLVPQIERPE